MILIERMPKANVVLAGTLVFEKGKFMRDVFYKSLKFVGNSYNWTVDEDNFIRGSVLGGKNSFTKLSSSQPNSFNPITAIAYFLGCGYHTNNKKETLKAGTSIGLSNKESSGIYDACVGSQNRGNSQVVRGKIKSLLNL